MKQKIFYICDRKKCKKCDEECHHTSDIKHALLFKRIGPGYFQNMDLAGALKLLNNSLSKFNKEEAEHKEREE